MRLWTLKEISRFSSSPDTAINYAEMLLDEAKSSSSLWYEARAHHTIGVAYRLKGDLRTALDYLFKAANIDQKLSNYSLLANDYSEIAACYSSLNDIQNALNYNTKAIDILRKSKDQSLRIVLLNTGYDYYSVGKYDTALLYYNEAEALFESANSKIGKAYTTGNRALVKWKTGKKVEAIADLKFAISMLVPLGDEFGMADYHNQLGNIYLELNDLKNASYHLSTGVRMAKAVDLKEQVRDASEMLSQIYYQNDQQDSAYLYLRQYLSMRDSIANEETIKALANQRADYEISLKQAEVDLANQQKKNRQILAIALGAVALLTGIFLVNFYLAYQKRKKLSQKLEALNATKDKFFSIVSHDLRGPISAFSGVSNIIKGYLRQKSYDELEEMTELIDKSANSLSELLDNLLNWAIQQQGQVPINPAPLDLNKVVESTLAIFESTATAKDIVLSNEVDRSVFIVADKDAIMTVFRNLVGNALKFTPSGGKIWVEAATQNAQVHVKVNDTGIGMSDEQIGKLFGMREKRSYGTDGETGLGVGLQLVNEFVALNGGEITVESKEQEGSTFIVSFPVPNVSELKKTSKEIA